MMQQLMWMRHKDGDDVDSEQNKKSASFKLMIQVQTVQQ